MCTYCTDISFYGAYSKEKMCVSVCIYTDIHICMYVSFHYSLTALNSLSAECRLNMLRGEKFKGHLFISKLFFVSFESSDWEKV